MDGYNDYMASGYGINSLASLGNAYAQAQALKAQGEYQKAMSRINARFAELAGEDAKKRGEKEARKVLQKGKQAVGTQRALAAAQGIDVDSGSALDLQIESEVAAAKDAMTLRNNAWREAWGYEVSANNSLGQGNMAALAAHGAANTTLLTGGMQALSSGVQAGAAYRKGRDDGEYVDGYSGRRKR